MRWIRKRVGWIAGAAVGGFLLWLVGTVVSIQTMGADSTGHLFGRKVPVAEYQSALQAVTRQAFLTHGEQYSQAVPEEELKRQAWERLILLAEAKRKRIRVSDQEVVEELQAWPIFQRDGRFDQKGYQAILQYMQVAPRTFEEEVRQMLTITKLLNQVAGNVQVTEEELKERFRQKEEAIQVNFLTLPQEHKALAQEVAEAARQDPGSLSQMAKELEVQVTASDFFKRSTALTGVGEAGIFFGPAFDLEPGEVTGPLFSPKGWMVVMLKAKQPADEERFPSMKEALQKDLISQKRLQAYLTWYQELLTRAGLKKNE